MGELVGILTSIALVDGMSMVPLTVVVSAIVFASPRPVTSFLTYIAGVFVAYYAFGVAVLLGLGSFFERLNSWFLKVWKHPDSLDLALQIAIGLVLLFFGVRMSARRRKREQDKLPDEPVTPWTAFVGGVVMTVVGMPGAVPFFAAADQLLRADLSHGAGATMLAYYVTIFVLPMFGFLIVRLVMGQRADAIFEKIDAFVATWGRRLIMLLLLGLGALMVIDGVGWFLGYPLIPIE